MLKSILVRDYALIENINIKFGSGLNIITGETGAGKSILVDAMSLLLGERASNEVVRKGSEKSIIEGIFDIEKNKKVKSLLEENEIEFQPELIIRREISLKGTNRCFINDSPVTLNIVKDLGNLLVDLHGQHEHQSLLRPETHIEFLDEFSGVDDLLRNFKWLHNSLNKLFEEYDELKVQANSLKEKKQLYEFQIKEIDSVSPQTGEDEKLEEELSILENSEKLLEITSGIYNNLYDSENSVYDSLVKIQNDLNKLVGIDKVLNEIEGECRSALAILKDMSDFIRSYNSKIEMDPERLEAVRARVNALNMLKKKFGEGIEKILGYREKIGREFDIAENYSEKISSVENKIKLVRENCGHEADNLSKKRSGAAKSIQKEVVKILADLGIANSIFKIEIQQYFLTGDGRDFVLINGKKMKYNSRGTDEVEFYISTNIGEDPKPLAKVASGGEISRIMLGLKTILAKNDKLPILIFDEIDTGISGPIAQKVGNALKSLAAFHQIISITHLPQIAALADHHFSVSKKTLDGRVVSSASFLNEEQRIREVAKLISGEKVTDASIKSARELMGIKS
jgi:DNA repair protein RecN (Recombination protein N)